MILTIKNTFVFIVIALSLSRCGQPDSPAEGEQGHQEEASAGVHEEGENEDVVELSDVQLANAALQYGSLDTLNVSDFIKANGSLDLPPQNIAAVSAPMDGLVKKANYLVGDYVEKGTVLAVLEHMDYVKLQEDYLNVISNLDYLASEYERQRQLDSAEVNSRKQFQAATAAYKSAQARKKALEKQLIFMGLSPKSVAQGNISSTISLRAPFSGHITALNVHNGAFAQSEQELYELVNTDHMHLELNVFEQDLRKVKVGQPIRFTVPSTGQESYQGEVYLVAKSFDPENKTVKVHGHIRGEHDNFIRGLYVAAQIYTGDQQVQALPEEAIVEDEGKSYIFIRTQEAHAEEKQGEATEAHEEHGETHGTSFRRIEVVTGEKDQGFVQIEKVAADLASTAEIVTKGAYYLFSEMKKGEGGHHH